MKKVRTFQEVEVTIEHTFVIGIHDNSNKTKARQKAYNLLFPLLFDDFKRTGKDPIKKLINKSKTKVITIKE